MKKNVFLVSLLLSCMASLFQPLAAQKKATKLNNTSTNSNQKFQILKKPCPKLNISIANYKVNDPPAKPPEALFGEYPTVSLSIVIENVGTDTAFFSKSGRWLQTYLLFRPVILDYYGEWQYDFPERDAQFIDLEGKMEPGEIKTFNLELEILFWDWERFKYAPLYKKTFNNKDKPKPEVTPNIVKRRIEINLTPFGDVNSNSCEISTSTVLEYSY